MGSENDSGSRRLSRREFNWLLVGIVTTAATGGLGALTRELTSTSEPAGPTPYIETEAYLEFLRRNQVSFTLHDATEDPKKIELVINNPEMFRPEINVAPRYGRLYTAHYPENIDWLSSQEREEKELGRVFESFANAGVKNFEFDLKGPYDLSAIANFIDFLSRLRETGMNPVISGDPEWVTQIIDFEDLIPEGTKLIPTLKNKHDVLAYKRNLENGWGNENSGATINYRSTFRDEIVRLNQANSRLTKLYGVNTEIEIASLKSEGNVEMEGARLIIGTDDPRLIQRANQAF